MKFSQFNSLVFMDASYALYNAFTQQLLFLEKELYDLLLSKPSVAELNEHHPSLYEHLVENSFIITDEIDGVDAVKQLSEKTDRDDSSFLLTINPNMTCNFGCYYCYETHLLESVWELTGERFGA